MHDDPIDRRRFAALLAGATALAACDDGGGADPAPPPDPDARPVVHLDALAAGRAVDFWYPEERHAAFAIKLGERVVGGVGPDGDIVAWHRACPHMGCAINAVDYEHQRLGPCPCHLSTFDLRSGDQVQGRATQGLVRVKLEVLPDGTVCATGLEGVPYGDPLPEST